MEEVVYPRDGDPVALRPCPAWCLGERHFVEDGVIDADDGFHHYGAEFAVPTSYQVFGLDGPETVVKTFLISWTHPLGAEPQPARIELQFGTAETNTDMRVELTPAQARAVDQGLLERRPPQNARAISTASVPRKFPMKKQRSAISTCGTGTSKRDSSCHRTTSS